MTYSVQLGHQNTIDDIRTFLIRSQAIDPRTVVRVIAKPGMIGFYAGIIYPRTLLDTSATVLGMRAFPAQTEREFDAAFKASSLLDALSRLEGDTLLLSDQDATQNAHWLGIASPLSGWEPRENIDAGLVREQAQTSMDAVAKALPNNPGHAVVETVRSRIWSSPFEGYPDLPTGVAFTAQALGFLPMTFAGDLPVLASGPWQRVNFPGGFVLSKMG